MDEIPRDDHTRVEGSPGAATPVDGSRAGSRVVASPDLENAVGIKSSAEKVRQHLAEQVELEKTIRRTLRIVDSKTGALQIHSSAEEILKWAPQMGWELVTAWSKMPVFHLFLFQHRAAFLEGGMTRAYADQVFPGGEDLLSAILCWRKRVSQETKGFAVFEGGFDTSGPVHLTDAPRLLMDAETGEVEGDGDEEISRKCRLHLKRQQMDKRWAAKGMSDDLRARIQRAEHLIFEKKRQGHEYMMKGGWVPRHTQEHIDLAAHNTRCKRLEGR